MTLESSFLDSCESPCVNRGLPSGTTKSSVSSGVQRKLHQLIIRHSRSQWRLRRTQLVDRTWIRLIIMLDYSFLGNISWDNIIFYNCRTIFIYQLVTGYKIKIEGCIIAMVPTIGHLCPVVMRNWEELNLDCHCWMVQVHWQPPGPGLYVMSHVYQILPPKESVLVLRIHGLTSILRNKNSRVQEAGEW